MVHARMQELEPFQGQRAAQRAGAWPYEDHMTISKGYTPNQKGILYIFLNFCYRVGIFTKVLAQN
jgi:hypothetical protein